MTRYGQAAYKQVAVDTAVASADPHRLTLMLYDGALEAVRQAASCMQQGLVAEKGRLLGKAVRIVEEGLKASLDRNAGGKLAQQLASLYDYAALRLLQANLRNDAKALDEVTRLLEDLRGAWAQIGTSAPAASAAPAAPQAATAAAAEQGAAAYGAPRLRLMDAAVPAPLRRVAVSA
jgi:flagellar secretion chaperone FliS